MVVAWEEVEEGNEGLAVLAFAAPKKERGMSEGFYLLFKIIYLLFKINK